MQSRSSFFVLCLGVLVLSTPAKADPAKDLRLIYRDLDGMCRGWSGDDPHTQQACDVRRR